MRCYLELDEETLARVDVLVKDEGERAGYPLPRSAMFAVLIKRGLTETERKRKGAREGG